MRRLLVLGLVCVALSVMGSGPAGAHAEVFESDPAASSTVATGTDEISLTLIAFDAEQPVTVSVTGPDGEEYAVGDPVVSSVDSVVTQAVRSLDEGAYTVAWTAMSTDGDGLSDGTYDFRAEDVGGGIGIYVIWALAVAVPAFVFLRPGARRSRHGDDDDEEDVRHTGIV